MKHETKLTFIKALAELDRLTNIGSDLSDRLQKEIENTELEEKELIILDLIEGAKENKIFIKNILKVEGFNLLEILDVVNNRITNNIQSLRNINDLHFNLLQILLELRKIESRQSINYIDKFYTLFQNLYSSNIIRNYWNNPLQPNHQDTVQDALFRNKSLCDLLTIHVLNLYKDESFKNNYKPQIANKLKFIISVYIRIAQKVNEAREALVPLSIVSLILSLASETQPLNHLGNVSLNEIFGKVVNYAVLNNLNKYLALLYDNELIYSFLDDTEQQINYIDQKYIENLLGKILDNGFYTENMLIDFHILFSTNIHNKYCKIIRNKNENNSFWYKHKVLSNLSEEEEDIIHEETIRFLLSEVLLEEKWFNNNEIVESVRKFIKRKISKIFEYDYIYEILEFLVSKDVKLDINYTTKGFGDIVIEKFKGINGNSHSKILEFIFGNIKKIFKEEEAQRLFSKLMENLTDYLSSLNENQLTLIENGKDLLKTDQDTLDKLFNKLVDVKENPVPYKLFNLLLERSINVLNDKFKDGLREKFNELKETVADDEVLDAMDTILNTLGSSSNAT